MFVQSLFNIDQIHLSRLERVTANRNSRRLRSNRIPEISRANPETVVLNFEEFSKNIVNFCNATKERLGNAADNALKQIIEIISSVNTMNEDIIQLLRDTDFFECTAYCIDPDHPTLLLHTIEVYASIAYLSPPLVTDIIGNGILAHFCEIFTLKSYSINIFEALIRLFCNVCADSPEARQVLYTNNVFDYLCSILAATDDSHAIHLTSMCLNSFFPDASLVTEDHIADAMLEPIKMVIVNYVPINDNPNIELRDQILHEVLSALSKFCTTEHNILSTVRSGSANLLLNMMDQIERPNLDIILETISVILSLNNEEVLQMLEPDIKLDFLISKKGRIVCDILASLFIADEETVQPALSLDAVGMALPTLEEGNFDEKLSVALMLAAAVLRSTESMIRDYFLNERIIDSFLDFWESGATQDYKNRQPIAAALSRIRTAAANSEEILDLFRSYEFEEEAFEEEPIEN